MKIKLILSVTMYVFLFVGFSLLLPNSILAESRTYASSKPVHEIIPNFIDEIGNRGIQFKIQKSYNETKDGKLGFQFLLMPRSRYVDIAFYSDSKTNGSLVKVLTQDRADSDLFYQILVKTMGLTEPGVKVPNDSNSGWPSMNR